MMTLGELLRITRTEKKISLDMLENALKVSSKVLESFEQDRIDPGLPPVYVRGFIHSYCRYVGIDEQEALRLYEEGRKIPGRIERAEKNHGKRKGSGSLKRLLLVLLFVVLAALAVYIGYTAFLTQKDSSFFTPPPAEDSPSPTPLFDETMSDPPLTAEPAHEPVPHAMPPTAPRSPESPSDSALQPSSPPPPAHVAATTEETTEAEYPRSAVLPTVRVQLVINEEVWIAAVIDSDPPVDNIYAPGNAVTWEAAEKIELRLGNAGGVALAVNGIPMKPFGRANQVVRLTFKDNTVAINKGRPQDLDSWRAMD